MRILKLLPILLLLLASCTTTENKTEETIDAPVKIVESVETPPVKEVFKPKTYKLKGKTINVVTHIENMVEIMTVLENNYPKINWVPVEYVHNDYYLTPNVRSIYGYFLILETKGEPTPLNPNFYVSKSLVQDGIFRKNNVDMGDDRIQSKQIYFEDESAEKIIERLPVILDEFNSKLSNPTIFQLPFDHISPSKSTPLLLVNDNKVLTKNRETNVEEVLFTFVEEESLKGSNYSWSLKSENIPSTIKQIFITLQYQDSNPLNGRFSTFMANVTDNKVEFSETIKASWVKGTEIKAIQLLSEENSILSYPYDLLPRIKEYNPEYFETYSKYIYWNHYDPTAD